MIMITEGGNYVLNDDSVRWSFIAKALPDLDAIKEFLKNVTKDNPWLLKEMDYYSELAQAFSLTERGEVLLECGQYNLYFTDCEAALLRKEIQKTIKPRIVELSKLMELLARR